MFKHAIVRLPGSNFAQGLTTAHLGVPVHDKVLQQHARYWTPCGNAASPLLLWRRIPIILIRLLWRLPLC